MVRQISSRLTFFYKFILLGLSAISIISTGILYLTRWSAKETPVTTGIIIAMLVGSLIVSVLFLPLKKVYVDERNLYVSDYRVDATIPLTNVARISESFLSEPRRVTIHFKQPTIFGEKVIFIATYRFDPFAAFTSHPVVSELREMISSS